MQPLSQVTTSDDTLALDSPERLRALYATGLLDTPPEAAFDRLTALACRLLNTSVCLISLVDADLQFFKSAHGLAEPWATRRETPLSHSFFQSVITSNAPLIIEDARTDANLNRSLAIPNLQVVGYLGVPLQTPEGHIIGSLCVIEDKPRTWSHEDVQTLADLAQLVMTEITVRRYINKQQAIQASLHKNNMLLEGVLSSIDDGIYVRDLEGRYLLVNQVGATLVESTPQMMIGKKFTELFPANTVAEIQEEDAKTLRTGETSRREQIWSSNGVHKTFDSTRSAYRDEQGNVVGILSVIHDISELKATEDALRISEENFRSLFESMTLGVVYQDANGSISNANLAAQTMLGLTLDELQGRKSIDPRWRATRADGNDFPGAEHPAMVALRTGQIQRNIVMYIFNPRQNELRCLRVDAVPQFRTDEQKPYQVYSILRDVTEQRRLNEKLAYHAHLLDNMHDAVIATDTQFNVTVWNRGAEQMYGWQSSEVINQRTRDFVRPEISEEVRQSAIQEVQTSGRCRMELITHHKDGTAIPTESITVVLNDGDGQIIGYLSINRDVSERKRAEEAVRNSMALVQQQLAEIELLYATTPVGLAVMDRDLRYVRINEYLASNNGYSIAEHIGRTGAELVPNLASQLNERLHQVMEQGEPLVNLEVSGTIPAQPNVEHTWLESFYPLRDHDGKVIGVNIVVQEITARKRIEEALRHSTEQLQMITDNVPALIAYIDREERYRFVNAAYEEWFGKSRDQILGHKLSEFINPATYTKAQPHIAAVLTGQPVTFEVDTIRNDGVFNWFMKYTPHFDANGKVVGFYTLTTDITELKQATAALQATEERFRATFEQAAVGIVHYDLAGNYKRVNNCFCEMLGYNRDELLQKNYQSTIHPDDLIAKQKQMQRLLAGECDTYSLEKRLLRKDGTNLWVNVTVSMVRNLQTYELEYFIGIVEDISERKQQEEALQELNATLEQRVAIRSKQLQTSNAKLLESESKFRQLSQQLMQITEQERKRISREIHDQLGQALTAIKMEVKGAQRRVESDPAVVVTRLQAANTLLDETVDIVRRIAADLRPGVLDHFGLGPAVEWLMDQFKVRNNINYQLEINIEPEVITPDMATASFRILQEALTNVVRHAQASEVNVTLTTSEAEFVMQVQDNGCGLRENYSQRQSLGVLGMSERAQQLGGSVELSSVELSSKQGSGAVVTLTLPIRGKDEEKQL